MTPADDWPDPGAPTLKAAVASAVEELAAQFGGDRPDRGALMLIELVESATPGVAGAVRRRVVDLVAEMHGVAVTLADVRVVHDTVVVTAGGVVLRSDAARAERAAGWLEVIGGADGSLVS